MRVLLLDNYDSFTYNLYQYLGELGAEVDVFRNDQITVDEALARRSDRIVISPGPGNPDQAGISLELIARAPLDVPLLGVCLGHQALGQAFGGKVVRAPQLMHGKTSEIHHDGRALFAGLREALHRDPLPLPGGGPRDRSRLSSRLGLDRGRGGHGPAPQDPAHLWRAVPPREHHDRGR